MEKCYGWKIVFILKDRNKPFGAALITPKRLTNYNDSIADLQDIWLTT